MHKVRVVAKKTLREFREKHKDVEEQLKTFFNEVSTADWRGPSDIRASCPKASIHKSGRVVFNIRGNNSWPGLLVTEAGFQRYSVVNEN